MSITAAIVLFAVIWFMVLFIKLAMHRDFQADTGAVERGTHASAPVNFNPKRTALIVSGVTVVLWVILAGTIMSGVVSVRDLDWLNQLTILPSGGKDG
ncbi:DUF1467 family protein [Actibacterium sp.]|uniref:DUF1467 family protein n=1 Tax=Actibacterium sp. TaxID=1872125 RepID=UPI00356863B1